MRCLYQLAVQSDKEERWTMLDRDKVYVLDTNAVYYLCGEDAGKYNIGSFRNDLLSVPYKIVPSCVFQEMIVKYRNNTDELGKILTTLAEQGFKIAPSQYDFLGEEFMKRMGENLSESINEQFEKKLDNESRLIYLFCFSVAMIYCRALAYECGIANPNAFLTALVKKSINPIKDKKFDQIKNILRMAYDDDDTEDAVKKIYIDITFELCVYGNAFAYMLKHMNKDGKCNRPLDEYLADPYVQSFVKHKNDINAYFPTFIKKHLTVLDDALREIPSFFIKKGYTQEQGEYIKNKIEKWMRNGAKLQKNDIYDWFYLYSYSDIMAKSFSAYIGHRNIQKKDIRLLSFDTDAKDFIQHISPESVEIIASYRE